MHCHCASATNICFCVTFLDSSSSFGGAGSSPFSSRFEEGRRGFADMGGASGGKETKTTRTITKTEGTQNPFISSL